MTRPVFIIVCGINGAGKSTLADALARSPDLVGLLLFNPDPPFLVLTNADHEALGFYIRGQPIAEACDHG